MVDIVKNKAEELKENKVMILSPAVVGRKENIIKCFIISFLLVLAKRELTENIFTARKNRIIAI